MLRWHTQDAGRESILFPGAAMGRGRGGVGGRGASLNLDLICLRPRMRVPWASSRGGIGLEFQNEVPIRRLGTCFGFLLLADLRAGFGRPSLDQAATAGFRSAPAVRLRTAE